MSPTAEWTPPLSPRTDSSGADVEDILENLLRAADGDLKKAERRNRLCGRGGQNRQEGPFRVGQGCHWRGSPAGPPENNRGKQGRYPEPGDRSRQETGPRSGPAN